MIFDTEMLEKIVDEAKMRKHNEISFFDVDTVLSRKTKDGYWEVIELLDK